MTSIVVFTLSMLESFLPGSAACRKSNFYIKKDVSNACKKRGVGEGTKPIFTILGCNICTEVPSLAQNDSTVP